MKDTTASVVAELNVALGTDHQVVRQLTGGLQSTAYELTGGVVLKWTDNPDWAPRVRRAAELVRRARAVGYPTPDWLAVGTTAAGSPYQLQELVPGSAPVLDEALARELIGICELQRDLVPEDHDVTWSGWSHGVVFDGWDGVWERVLGYDDQASELVRRYGELCRPYRDDVLPRHDFVHGDLNMGNLLVSDGRITGIVDIEAAGGGARAYDLVSLAASAARDGAAAGVDELFLEAALRANGRAAVAVCAGAAFASVAEFVHNRSTYSHALVTHGGHRLLELLDA
ncbi:aminoglycoside phosphotransferase (APT) family kinase protein [Kribbella aluminosa]|uniref:Aminoglycoside phosphotransferase (APT) family kinase protein n=1 Tax=Kribbella aluminosa TaxID=416017 RepID=A0ABS4UG79_9ACTN|nr:aminoglycoside phosphotransferase family protein [Kribbella aluminosa]MBP2350625.1 aminoglycoside phosphotransferase (APT) family kinase protein [Kribbella aluminosa]